MITADLHIHTRFCDGKSTPEEIVLKAIKKGYTAVGISGHGYTPFEDEYCMSLKNTQAYIKEITRLKEKYKDKIKVLLGIEQDMYSDFDVSGFDYRIGSMHYFKIGDKFYEGDHQTEKGLQRGVNELFSGDYYAMAEEYFRALAEQAIKKRPDIIGHFDLITKLNEGNKFFDVEHPRYIAAWQAAINKILPLSIPFEINTGAISRGYRTTPYPSLDIIKYIRDKGGKFVLTSDSHHVDTVGFELEKWEAVLKPLGLNILNSK